MLLAPSVLPFFVIIFFSFGNNSLKLYYFALLFSSSEFVMLSTSLSNLQESSLEEKDEHDLPFFKPLRYYSPTNPHALLPTLNYTMNPTSTGQEEEVAQLVITATYAFPR